ncbi:MAG: hypothetical protein GF411_11335 [Candidatus Lokiarchaeota archaeon]|nr:hypothetical protein [Candidatus Lokiarchaeota archaeon]
MKTSCLRVIRNQSDNWEYSRPYANASTGKLYESASNQSLQLSLREVVLYELALRQDERVMDICEKLFDSADIDEWLLGLRILSVIGTEPAMDRLVQIYTDADVHGRKLALDIIASSVSADFAQPFSIMVREFIGSESIDVSTWTSVAIATLYHVCKRKGINVEFLGDPNFRPSITGFEVSSTKEQSTDRLKKTRLVAISKEN